MTCSASVLMFCCISFLLSPVLTDAKSLAGRRSKGLILLEGRRLVKEAIQTNQELKSIFFTQPESVIDLPIQQLVAKGVKMYKIKSDHMKLWSDTVTPQGIMGS